MLPHQAPVCGTQRSGPIDLRVMRLIERFSNQSSRNNNEETRIMKNGPLAGMIVAASQGMRAPWGYGIAVYRLSKAGNYEQILKYVGKTRYGDGNEMAVIILEMPEIERRPRLLETGRPIAGAGACTMHFLYVEKWN